MGDIVALTSMNGYLWAATSQGYLYRILPQPLDVVQIYPPPAAAVRGVPAEDRTFDSRRADLP
jgi:hypothetical protein